MDREKSELVGRSDGQGKVAEEGKVWQNNGSQDLVAELSHPTAHRKPSHLLFAVPAHIPDRASCRASRYHKHHYHLLNRPMLDQTSCRIVHCPHNTSKQTGFAFPIRSKGEDRKSVVLKASICVWETYIRRKWNTENSFLRLQKCNFSVICIGE